MPANMFRQALHRDVTAMVERGKAQCAGPGVVDHCDRACTFGDRGQRGDIAHFHGQAARAFKPHCARTLFIQNASKGVMIERVEKAVRHPQTFEQAGRHAARGIVGIVAHHKVVAGSEHGQHAAGDGGHPAGIEHCAMRARLDLG